MNSALKTLAKALFLRLPLGTLFKVVRSTGILRNHENLYWWLRFRGKFDVHVTNDERVALISSGASIENSIFWSGLYGSWESESIDLWVALARSADVIFDVGANTGIYSVVAQAVNPNAQIHAFEPNARVFEDLIGNVRVNGFRIVCHCKAVSNFDGTTTFYEVTDRSGYSSSLNGDFLASTSHIARQVPVTRLDTFAANQGLKTLDLIKIDVETHEKEVLDGLGEMLTKFSPSILIEVLNDEIGIAIETLIRGKDYVYVASSLRSDATAP
jgi:FkbM family methyltransferase